MRTRELSTPWKVVLLYSMCVEIKLMYCIGTTYWVLLRPLYFLYSHQNWGFLRGSFPELLVHLHQTSWTPQPQLVSVCFWTFKTSLLEECRGVRGMACLHFYGPLLVRVTNFTHQTLRLMPYICRPFICPIPTLHVAHYYTTCFLHFFP